MNGTKNAFLAVGGVLVGAAVVFLLMLAYSRAYVPSQKPGDMPLLASNQLLLTANTTRIGSDDPIESAVAVSQLVYPATEEENTPGAVILVNQNSLAEVLVAASRVTHFPVNAPLLYVTESELPELTRAELLRLKPEGVPMDGNTQVYLVGTLGDQVRQAVEDLGYKTRVLRAENPIELAVVADDWSSTMHGDHLNEVAILNLDQLEPGIPSAFWNAHMGQGLAFVTDEGVPEATRALLERRAHGPWLYVFGDETVVSVSTARELAQYGQVTRIPHSDPAAASAYFAGFKDLGADWGAWFWQGSRDFGWGLSEAGHNAIFVNIDGPSGWQNAAVATTLSHMGKHAPVLIVEQDAVPEAVVNYLQLLQPYLTAPQQQLLNHGWIIGGEGTISWETQARLEQYLSPHRPAADEGGG